MLGKQGKTKMASTKKKRSKMASSPHEKHMHHILPIHTSKCARAMHVIIKSNTTSTKYGETLFKYF
jgi:hypothetical protein